MINKLDSHGWTAVHLPLGARRDSNASRRSSCIRDGACRERSDSVPWASGEILVQ
jgi:hypothetical protein